MTMIAGSHSRSFAIGEAEGIRMALEAQHAAGRLTACLCCVSNCPVWDRPKMKRFLAYEAARVSGGGRGVLHSLWSGFYTPIFTATGAQVLVDSSKRIDWLDQRMATLRDWIGAEPRMLFITRDGRGSVNSWARKYPDRPFEDHVRKWLANVERAERAFDRFPDKQRIRLAYEDVARDPEAAARSVCDFLGLAHEPGMGDYWIHEHHVLRGNAGTLSLLSDPTAHAQAGVDAPLRQKFYSDIGRSVSVDEAWRTDMSEAQLALFEQIAGPANANYSAK